MNKQLNIAQRNGVLTSMAKLIAENQAAILAANQIDLDSYTGDDISMRDRLKVDPSKIDGMILSLEQLSSEPEIGRASCRERVFRAV